VWPDDFRLLMDFLGHEVAIVRLSDQRRRGALLDRIAVNDGVVLVVDNRAVARQHDPVAVLEISDGVGDGPSAMASEPRYISPSP